MVAAALLAALGALSPQSGLFRGAWRAIEQATAASRLLQVERREAVQAALRYGIPVELAVAIADAARQERLDTDLAFRLVRVESEFYERAESSAGALGLTQLMPATAAGMRPGISREQILERETNLRLGFRYLHWLLNVHGGDVREALLAYNRGMGTVARIRSLGGDPGNGYAARVLGSEGVRPVGFPPALMPASPAPLHELGPAWSR